MRSLLHFSILLFTLLLTTAATAQVTYTWTGAGDGEDWNDVGNWDTDDDPSTTNTGVPSTSDEAIIDSDATITMASAGTPTISRLFVRGAMNRLIELQIDLNVTGQAIDNRAVQINAGQLIIADGATLTVTAQGNNDGIFLNNSNSLLTNNGQIVVDGGDDESSKALGINEGTVNNLGTLMLTGGQRFSRATVSATGTLLNGVGGTYDTGNGRTTVDAGGVLTNDGLYLTDLGRPLRTEPGVTTDVTNNGFYRYAGGSRPFADGNVRDGDNEIIPTGSDNGIDLNDSDRTTIDAAGSCAIDIAESPYDYFEGATPVGSTDATGAITLMDLSATDVTITNGAFPEVELMIINVCAAALPVDLTTFTARPTPKTIELKWETASETDNDYIVVEKSQDGIDFTELGRVRGQGSTTDVQTYQLADRQPFNGINYYRLRQVDFDGTNNLSDVIAANFNGSASALRLYPTLVTGGQPLNLNLSDVDGALTLDLRIVDTNGRIVRELTVTGGQLQVLSVTHLAPGMYYLMGEWVEATRFMIGK